MCGERCRADKSNDWGKMLERIISRYNCSRKIQRKLITFVGAASLLHCFISSLCQPPTPSALLKYQLAAVCVACVSMCFNVFRPLQLLRLLLSFADGSDFACRIFLYSFRYYFVLITIVFVVVWTLLLDRNGEVIFAIMVEGDSEKWVPSSRIKWSLKLSSSVK